MPRSVPSVSRRRFLARSAAGAALAGLGAAPARAASAAPKPVLMHAGHQHDHSETTLRALAAFGVKNICSGQIGPATDTAAWSVEGLVRLRKHVESFGLKLDCVPLPLSSRAIAQSEHPEILLAKDPERDRTLEHFRQMIRNCGRAGIPMAKYNLTFIGVVRTARTIGRGGASLSTFEFAKSKPEGLTEAGRVTDEIYWDRIWHFLKKLVPVAEEARVKIACHPQDPAMPPGTGWRGVETVLGTPAGLRKFVELEASPYHGLNFCQGTVSEMLEKPGEQIYDVIRDFGRRGKIFNVHFRNIRGGYLNFAETMPDDGDVDMLRALRTYREVGYAGMIMPDHVPQILGDPQGQKAFAFCFGYIQALLQALRAEG